MNSKAPFWINDCLIEPELSRITYNSDVQSVEPRVLAVLMVLHASIGRVVARDDIINQVWGNRVTSDSSLSRNIALLRKLLDKSDSKESCINTVPKKGYMLLETCVKVEKSLETTNEPVSDLSSDTAKTPSTFVRKTPIAIGFCMIAVSILVWWLLILPKDNNHLLDESSSFFIKEDVTFSPHEHKAAFCFDGLDDYVETPSRPALDIETGDFSLSAWVKTETQGIAVILDKRKEQRSGDVRGYNFHVLHGEVGMQLADGDGEWRCSIDSEKSSCTNYYSGTRVADNQWHFVAVTIDRDAPNGLKFFVDGKLVRTHNPTFRTGSLTNRQPLRIGSRSSSKSAFFPGFIGEVKIYRYILTPEAIEQQFLIGNQRTCGRRN